MKRHIQFLAVVAALGLGAVFAAALPQAAWAQSTVTSAKNQTQSFAVENMTCALCPITIRKAMEGVPGVQSVKVDFDTKTATVTFNPSQTNADTIAAASTNAGYPAKPTA